VQIDAIWPWWPRVEDAAAAPGEAIKPVIEGKLYGGHALPTSLPRDVLLTFRGNFIPTVSGGGQPPTSTGTASPVSSPIHSPHYGSSLVRS